MPTESQPNIRRSTRKILRPQYLILEYKTPKMIRVGTNYQAEIPNFCDHKCKTKRHDLKIKFDIYQTKSKLR